MVRLDDENMGMISRFVFATEAAWRVAGLVRANSFGTVLLVARVPGADFTHAREYAFGNTLDGVEHDKQWYLDNAVAKNALCLRAGMDSREVVRLWQGLAAGLSGAFPYGGAVIDTNYGLIVGTSGFAEDEDVLFSRTLRNFVVMLLDRVGESQLQEARDNGNADGAPAEARFTA